LAAGKLRRHLFGPAEALREKQRETGRDDRACRNGQAQARRARLGVGPRRGKQQRTRDHHDAKPHRRQRIAAGQLIGIGREGSEACGVRARQHQAVNLKPGRLRPIPHPAQRDDRPRH
jgi:hypothetical protein